jgi:hypothetical protein
MADEPKGSLTETARIALDATKLLVEHARGLRRHLALFMSMPSVALEKLEEVLKQIKDTFSAVDDAIEEFLRLALHPDTIAADKDPLVRLSGPVLPQIVEDGRGHCEKIELIRGQYLDGWLDPLRRNHEAAVADIKRIFASLEKADGELFDKLVATASSMQDIARDALKKVLAQDNQGAIEEFRRAVPPLIDLRVALQDAQIELIRVKNAFIRGMRPSGTATPWRERFASLLRRGTKPELPA